LNELSNLLQIWYRDGGRTPPAYGKQNDPKWAWPGSRDPISKFWDPLITFERKKIRFKFGTDVEDGASLRKDHKTTTKWAWPGSYDQLS